MKEKTNLKCCVCTSEPNLILEEEIRIKDSEPQEIEGKLICPECNKEYWIYG